MFVGIKLHYVYGLSGAQFAPLVEHVIKSAELINVNTYKEASDIMEAQMVPLRKALKTQKGLRPNRWDFEVIHIEEIE